MKDYHSKSLRRDFNFRKMKDNLAALGIVLPENNPSKIGVTKKSHEISKKRRLMAKKSRRINRRK